MSYEIAIHPECRREIKNACKRNPVLRKIIRNKINEIILNPYRYKPLRYSLKGERRVHIMKNFVLRFEIDERHRRIIFLAFKHHDKAYKR